VRKNFKYLFRLSKIFVILLSLPFAVFLSLRKVPFINKAYHELIGSKANLVIDVFKEEKFNPHWRFLAQGGEERGKMLVSVVEKTKKLEPFFIRIDHIYDFYDVVRRNDNKELVFNWDKLDVEIATIQAIGARPFISLSYMPKVLTKGTELDEPYSYEEWKLLVRKTIEHISGKDGLAIPGVYYEVWNEPDFFGKFKLRGDKNYLSLYYYAERGAKQASNTLPFMIGGPATTSLYKNWFFDFFNFAEKNNLRVDFYSWHIYSKDISTFEKNLKDAKEWLQKFPRYLNTQFVISESGFSSENDVDYDTDFGAIHTLSMYAATFGKVPMIFVFEVKDGPGERVFWGRWGILTHEKFGEPIEKPRFKAIEFLNLMKGNAILLTGNGTWVKGFATNEKENKVIRLLVVNYDPNGFHREKFPVTFKNLPFSRFKLRRIDFLGSVQESKEEARDGLWTKEINFDANKASIFELRPE